MKIKGRLKITIKDMGDIIVNIDCTKKRKVFIRDFIYDSRAPALVDIVEALVAKELTELCSALEELMRPREDKGQ